jgi:hypothetical protein
VSKCTYKRYHRHKVDSSASFGVEQEVILVPIRKLNFWVTLQSKTYIFVIRK